MPGHNPKTYRRESAKIVTTRGRKVNKKKTAATDAPSCTSKRKPEEPTDGQNRTMQGRKIHDRAFGRDTSRNH